jgi:hypothetical protein
MIGQCNKLIIGFVRLGLEEELRNKKFKERNL